MTLRVGFVGAGNMASRHVENVGALDGATVAAVCDVDADRANEVATARDAAAYTDHAAMLDAESPLDAVYLAIPPFAHDGQALDVLETGAALFVEKPLGLDASYPRRVGAAVAERDAVTQVGYVLRYDGITDRALELVGDRQVALADANYWVGTPPMSWWSERSFSGGQVVEQSTHLYDLLRLFAGEVTSVAAAGDRTVVDDIDFEDATSATMRHESGATGHVSSTSAAPDARLAVSLVGEGFRLELDYLEGTLSGVVDGESVAFESTGDRLRREDEAFLDAVRDGDPEAVRSPYADGRRTFELTLAVEDALDRDRTLPLDPPAAGGE